MKISTESNLLGIQNQQPQYHLGISHKCKFTSPHSRLTKSAYLGTGPRIHALSSFFGDPFVKNLKLLNLLTSDSDSLAYDNHSQISLHISIMKVSFISSNTQTLQPTN
jgi:hypothetical protein